MKHRSKLPPTHPFYADARWFGLTWETRVRSFIFVLTATVIILIAYVIDHARVSDQRHADQTATNQTAAESRAETNADLRQLACLLVQFAPPGNTTGDIVRAKYSCPPFGSPVPAPSNPQISAPAAPSLRLPVPSSSSGARAKTPPVTRTATITAPTTQISTVAAPPASTVAGVSTVPTALCKLLPVLCGPDAP